MYKFTAIIALCSSAALLPACDSKPCSGGGMAADGRPLPAAWSEVMPALPGAVACRDETGITDQEFSRSYEIGKDADDGKRQWTKHLVANGWAKGSVSLDDDAFVAESFDRDGHELKVSCSRAVKDKGWCTVVFTPGG
ncbi:MAG: hypothetical protein AAGA54_20570 [Myxococcota bacterium]